MAKKKKIKHIINWNLITIISTFGIVLMGIIINYNTRKMETLEFDLTRKEKENQDLIAQIDPNWHIKFNNQKEFYENQLKKMKIENLNYKNMLASTKEQSKKNTFNLIEGKLELTINEAKHLATRLITADLNEKLIISYKKSRVLDSLQLLNYKKLKDNSVKIINNLEEMAFSQEKIINLMKQKELILSKYRNSPYKIILLLLGIVGLISSSFSFSSIKKKKNSSHK